MCLSQHARVGPVSAHLLCMCPVQHFVQADSCTAVVDGFCAVVQNIQHDSMAVIVIAHDQVHKVGACLLSGGVGTCPMKQHCGVCTIATSALHFSGNNAELCFISFLVPHFLIHARPRFCQTQLTKPHRVRGKLPWNGVWGVFPSGLC